jgi:hypothetical protein
VPSFTIGGTNLQGAGPVVDVQIGVNKDVESDLRDSGQNVPAPYLALAMIDTGASLTVIREGLAQDLGLQPTGVRMIHTPSDTNVRCHEYLVRLLFPNGIVFEMDVVEAPLKGQHIDCLVGRDVLARGILVYIGPDNLFTLSF